MRTDNACVLHRHTVMQIQHVIYQVAVEALIPFVDP